MLAYEPCNGIAAGTPPDPVGAWLPNGPVSGCAYISLIWLSRWISCWDYCVCCPVLIWLSDWPRSPVAIWCWKRYCLYRDWSAALLLCTSNLALFIKNSCYLLSRAFPSTYVSSFHLLKDVKTNLINALSLATLMLIIARTFFFCKNILWLRILKLISFIYASVSPLQVRTTRRTRLVR